MTIEKKKNEFMNSCSKPFNQTGESIQLSVVSALAFFPQKFNLGICLRSKRLDTSEKKKCSRIFNQV